jgi:hypothetical protein
MLGRPSIVCLYKVRKCKKKCDLERACVLACVCNTTAQGEIKFQKIIILLVVFLFLGLLIKV